MNGVGALSCWERAGAASRRGANMLPRRQVLPALLAACLPVAACAQNAAPSAIRPIELATGVYMFPGSSGAADESNLGRIGNSGFIVGDSAVVAVDTGTSYAHGKALLAAIRSVTDKPVRVAIVTHTRPEFLFGGAAFREASIPIRMNRRTAGLMASRCETCLKTLRQTLGPEAMQGTVLYKADQEYDATHELSGIGRPVRVLSFGHSSGPGDSAVLDARSGVLFAGGLLDVRRIPDIQDGDLEGWKKGLRELRALNPSRVVPGHGPAAQAPQAIAEVERYLAALEKRVRALLEAGTSLLDVAEACELPDYQDWDQYDAIHRRNASIAFLRFERELMFK
jgi:glyoxylase-like metal-dependent hydrolase (beta-lactamase superfamily II)